MRLTSRPNSPHWYAEFTTGDGRVHRLSTKHNATPRNRGPAMQAGAALREAIEASLKGRGGVTFEYAVSHFLAKKGGLRASTMEHYAGRLAELLEHVGRGTPLRQLDPAFLRQLLKERRKLTTDLMVRREFTALSSMFEHAINGNEVLDATIEINPVRQVDRKHLDDAEKKKRSLTPKELDRLVDEANRHPDPFWPAFVNLLVETGMRHEEALGLTWEEVYLADAAGGLATVLLDPDRSKTGDRRCIPVTDDAMAMLAKLPRFEGVDHVFVNPETGRRLVNVQKGWVGIRTRAGVPKARIHDLRHTFSTMSRESGMAEDDRMSIQGHSIVATQRAYARGGTGRLAAEVKAHSPLSGRRRRTEGGQGPDRSESFPAGRPRRKAGNGS